MSKTETASGPAWDTSWRSPHALLFPARPARDRGNDVDQLNIEMILKAAVENDSLAFRVPGFLFAVLQSGDGATF
jgi:hypothetical protein